MNLKEVSFSFRGVIKETPDEYLNYLLCKTFKWTYEELMSQPASFIEDLLFVMGTEGKEARKRWRKKR